MKLLSNGEARTDGVCQVCKTEHRLVSDDDRGVLEERGFTTDEIEGIAKDLEGRYSHLERGSPDFHVKPSATKEARAERKRRSRAARKSSE